LSGPCVEAVALDQQKIAGGKDVDVVLEWLSVAAFVLDQAARYASQNGSFFRLSAMGLIEATLLAPVGDNQVEREVVGVLPVVVAVGHLCVLGGFFDQCCGVNAACLVDRMKGSRYAPVV
jgi:hypothetical protein